MARRFTVHPTGRDGANALISRWHRHCGPVVVAMDCLELREGARACGVGVLGKPLSAILDDGVTLEVRRTATDGTEHACSAVLGALARAARRRSVLRLVTYTREGESGSSLRGAGWWLDENYHRDWEIIGTRLVHLILPKPARSWSSPSRPRRVATLGAPRFRWWKLLPDACTFDGALRLGAAAGRMHQVSGCPFPYDGPNGRWRSIWGEGYDYPNAVPDPAAAGCVE